MKTITLDGHQYEVEDWANWAARDCDNELYVFELEPMLGEDGVWRANDGLYLEIDAPLTWRESKVKL